MADAIDGDNLVFCLEGIRLEDDGFAPYRYPSYSRFSCWCVTKRRFSPPLSHSSPDLLGILAGECHVVLSGRAPLKIEMQ